MLEKLVDERKKEAEIKRRASYNAWHLTPVAAIVVVIVVCMLLAAVMGPFLYLARCQVVGC